MEIYYKISFYASALTAVLSLFLSFLIVAYFNPPPHVVLGFCVSVIGWAGAFYTAKNKIGGTNFIPGLLAISFFVLSFSLPDIALYRWSWLSSCLAFAYMQSEFRKNNLKENK